MNRYDRFEELNGGQRLLAILSVLTIAGAILAFLTGGWLLTLIAVTGLNGLFWITRRIWMPSALGADRVRMASLGVVLSVGTLLAAGPQLSVLLSALTAEGILGELPSWLENVLAPDPLISVAVMVFTLVAVFIVNWFARDTSAMREHPRPFSEEFPEKRYPDKLKQFCEVLHQGLRELNQETNWADAFFTPLEAEVEIVSGTTRKRRFTDLMRALRQDHGTRAFVLLGDPGSGKSIALRTLAARLLDEVQRTRRVPVYINLKEWNTDTPWSEDNPPTPEQFQNFVLRYLKAHSDVFGAQFLDAYFERMLEHGRFFFLLDSFDEIPGVLDVPDSSWLLERISGVISRFLVGAGETRGIVGSRLFRRPRLTVAGPVVTLEIRPFDESRIVETLKHSDHVTDDVVRRLFRDRPELVPIGRNPFTANLIQSYITEHRGQLPPNQLAL